MPEIAEAGLHNSSRIYLAFFEFQNHAMNAMKPRTMIRKPINSTTFNVQRLFLLPGVCQFDIFGSDVRKCRPLGMVNFVLGCSTLHGVLGNDSEAGDISETFGGSLIALKWD